MAVLIQGPALGQGLFHLVVHLQLAPGDNGGGGVKEEVVRLGGEGAGDGVAAQHGLAAVGGHHDGLAVGAGEAHEALLAGHLGVVARDAEVVGIAHGDNAHAGGFRLFNGHFHGLVAHQLAHGVMGVDDSGDGSLKDHLGLGVNVNHTLFDALVVAHHPLHTVGLDAVQVRGQQHILNDVGFRFRKAELGERVHAQPVQGFIGPVLICHSVFLLYSSPR